MPADLTTAISTFTIDLYRQLLSESCGETDDIVISPFSITAALSITLAGDKGNTAAEIAKVLHTSGVLNHGQFSEFFARVSTYAPDVMLDIANCMYAGKTFVVLEDCLATLKKYSNSTVVPVNFKTEAEAARLAIDAWVEETTTSKIKDLLTNGVVDSDTALVLVNAIYFKGLWKDQVNSKAISLQEFHTSKESSKEVDMMYKQSRFGINTECTDLNANAIEIPCRSGETSMVILLPYDIDGLAELEAAFTPSKLLDILNSLHSRMVALSLPRFKIDYSVNLKQTLFAVGVKHLFSNNAGLSG
ncbi:hypothetical protein HPB52_016625 [Rhipicephalus sanguineus]|uniref:Serpin domain-containing protein n=1 Tax=Rhipicephalus sanguineus TaxID=34632 RepID=A0A9D4T5Z3_RHISA|nr:hypothetical protein HPB52_016625 [Rhipicephalus sanguineus]